MNLFEELQYFREKFGLVLKLGVGLCVLRVQGHTVSSTK